VRAVDGCMRGHAEYPPLQLVLETVHDRRHDDEYRNRKADADHRNQRDERDKALAAACAEVAGRDRELVRLPHRRDSERTGTVIRSAALPPERWPPPGVRDTASRARSARTRRAGSRPRPRHAPRT